MGRKKEKKRVTKKKVEENVYRSAGKKKKKKSIALGRPMVVLDVSYSYTHIQIFKKKIDIIRDFHFSLGSRDSYFFFFFFRNKRGGT